MNILINTASAHSIKPQFWSNRNTNQLYAQLNKIVASCQPQQRAAFAEPVNDPNSGSVAFYTSPYQHIRHYSALNAVERTAYKQKLSLLTDAIENAWHKLQQGGSTERNVQRALESILRIPSTDYLYEVDGVPLITGWAHISTDNSYIDLRTLAAEPEPQAEPKIQPPPAAQPAPQPEPATQPAAANNINPQTSPASMAAAAQFQQPYTNVQNEYSDSPLQETYPQQSYEFWPLWLGIGILLLASIGAGIWYILK